METKNNIVEKKSSNGDFLTGFAEYCTDPIQGETGKGISYEKAFRYLCEYLNIDLYSFKKTDLASIKKNENDLKSKSSELYSKFLEYLQKKGRASYLTKGHLKAAFPYFYEFSKKKMTEEIKEAKKISKNEAIALIKNAGINIAGKITFSSTNSNSLVYWANPNTNYLDDEWWIILNDCNTRTLHVFDIPKGAISLNQMTVRKDKPCRIDIQIELNNSQFIDIRSKIRFDKWLIKSLKY